MQTFNATQSAIKVGYLYKTSWKKQHRLSIDASIEQKIQFEMKRLRNRMRDEGLRSFSMLLGIAMQTEEKIQAHNEAEIDIDNAKRQLIDINEKYDEFMNEVEEARRKILASDHFFKVRYDEKGNPIKRFDSIKKEYFELNLERVVLLSKTSVYQPRYLDAKEWERLKNFRRSFY
ncbi:terminase small subunit [Enterococcus faecalis]|uniref:terminase small subunit n=1 Tax=Enterococcus faecalis TaxID=1351 RepID=UPI003DA08B10